MKGGTKELFLVCGLILYIFPLTDTFQKAGVRSFFGTCAVCTDVLSSTRSERKAELAKAGRIHTAQQGIKTSGKWRCGLICTCLDQNKTISTWQHPGAQKVVSPALKQRSRARSQNTKFRHRCSFRVLISPPPSPDSSWKGSASVPEITTPALTRCKCHACLLRFQPHFPSLD